MTRRQRIPAIAIFIGVVTGCISKAKDGAPEVDLRGCGSTPKAKEPLKLSDGPVTMEVHGAKTPIVSAVAWGVKEEEAVSIIYSSTALRCDEVRLATDGATTYGHANDVGHLTLAPMMIEQQPDRDDRSHSIVPVGETWQVVNVSAPFGPDWGKGKPSFFGTSTRSASDSARGAATKGRRTKVRVAVEVGGDRLAGALDIEGCGEIEFKRARRPQPNVELRIGERRATIRGATYRKLEPGGDSELRLTSAPADCDGADPGDVDVEIRNGRVVIKGALFGTAYNYFGHGLSVVPAMDDAGVPGGERIKVFIRGTFKRPDNSNLQPRTDLERRDFVRHVNISGEVDALMCPSGKQ